MGGRSLCPECGKQIAWFDNIPLLSYLLLGGKCRHCHKTISARYPLIEAATGLAFVGLYFLLLSCSGSAEPVCVWKSAYGLAGAVVLFTILLVTISIFVIDLEERLIPDELIFTGFFLVLIPLTLGAQGDLYRHLFGAFSAATFLLLINMITLGKGMGLGDVKYALFSGLFFGWPLSFIWLFLAFLTGAAVAIILILSGRAGRKDKIAFGPFLALSFVLTAIWGQQLIDWILLR